MKATDDIIEKLTKLLTLADPSRGGTPAEIELAMAKAKELAMRHSLDLAAIQAEKKDEKGIKVDVQTDQSLKIRTRFEQQYHSPIFSVLQHVFEVRVITSRWRCGPDTVIGAIYLVGEATDVAIAKEIFKWLETLFPKAFSAWKKERLPIGPEWTLRNGFYAGLASGICKANKRAEEQLTKQENECYGLILRSKKEAVDAKVAEEFPNLKTPHRHRQMDGRSFAAGQEKGEKIKLNRLLS